MLSERAKLIKESATLALAAKAKALAASGQDVISLTAGEPDFETPEPIKEAAIQATRSGFTRYTPNAGIPELREAICARFRQDAGLSYAPNQVIVSNGAKQSIFNLLMALVGPGDEVLFPSPYWLSYWEMTIACGAIPVPVPCAAEAGFRVDPARLEAAATTRAKVLILNSPSNPTGIVFPDEDVRMLADFAVRRGLTVISDEIYDRLAFHRRPLSPAAVSPEAYARTVVVNGCSKAYAMTGWRIGYAAGPREIVAAADRLQSHMTSGPNSMAQKAAVAALTGPQDSVERMRLAYRDRGSRMAARLNAMPGVRCIAPEGAFYAFPDCSPHTRKLGGSTPFAERLLDERRLSVVPGEPFGGEGHIRLSFACSERAIEDGLDRLEGFLRGL